MIASPLVLGLAVLGFLGLGMVLPTVRLGRRTGVLAIVLHQGDAVQRQAAMGTSWRIGIDEMRPIRLARRALPAPVRTALPPVDTE